MAKDLQFPVIMLEQLLGLILVQYAAQPECFLHIIEAEALTFETEAQYFCLLDSDAAREALAHMCTNDFENLSPQYRTYLDTATPLGERPFDPRFTPLADALKRAERRCARDLPDQSQE